MANYEDAAGVTDVINNAAAAGGLSQETADAINTIVNQLADNGQAANAEVVATDITSAAQVTAPVVIMDANTKADVTFTADSPVKAMVVGGAGDSNVKFETNDDVAVQLGGGENDSVATGGGNDTITFAGGSATIDTGEGDDQVVIQNEGHAEIKGGSGNMTIQIQTDISGASASIDAGDGFDAVSLTQGRVGHFFSFLNGVFRMVKNAIDGHDEGIARAAESTGGLDMQNVNVVQFTDSDGNIEDLTILADTKGEAMVGRLYSIALGRQAIDANGNATNIDGLTWWEESFGASKDDVDLDHLAKSFVNCDEFYSKYGDNMTSQQFADAMFANLNAVNDTSITAVNGMTAADLAAQVESGALSRVDAAIMMANSQEAMQVTGVDGAQYVIDGAQ